MKKLRIILLPAAIVLIGAGAAFASNSAKASVNKLERGYYYDASAPIVKCIRTETQCTTTPGERCTWTDNNKVTHELSTFISNTMCGDDLYRQ